MASDSTAQDTLQIASIFDQLLATKLSDNEFEEAMNRVSSAYFDKRSELLAAPINNRPSTSLTLMQRLINAEVLIADLLDRVKTLESTQSS